MGTHTPKVKRFWTTKSAMQELGICQKTMTRYCQELKIPSTLNNKPRRILSITDLDRLRQHKQAKDDAIHKRRPRLAS